jgi:hypothetical protein
MGKAVTDVALDRKLEQFVRETAQNSADAALEDETPHLIYRYVQLEGNELKNFLETIDWDNLQPHLESVAEGDDEIGVQSMLDRIDRGKLPLLIVEDRNAEGLEGEEFSKETNYASLLQDFGSSTKDEDEGGVHGVGASVLWGFSAFKTSLFFTNPAGWSDDESPRLVGRIDLPYHECPDQDGNQQEWQGDGWIGAEDDQGRRAVSIKGEEATEIATDQLHIEAANERSESSGTTAVVVGFREPSRSRRSPAKVVERIGELAARYYWPLIVEGGLKVSVEGPKDDEPKEVHPDDVDWLTPFIEAYNQCEQADNELDEAPDVAATEVPVTIPHNGDQPTDGEVTLAIRSEDGDYDKFKNQIAMFRGARHVVKYRQYGYTARTAGQEFHGLLLAGRARYSSDVDEDDIAGSDAVVEDFFRKAEPEAHNTWEQEVSKLENNYPGGHEAITTLIEDRVPSTLEDLLIDAGTDETESMESVGGQFPYFSGGPSYGSTKRNRPGGGGSIVENVSRKLNHPGDRYECTGVIELAEQPAEKWEFEIEIGVVDAGGNQFDTVALDNISARAADGSGNVDDSDTRVVVDEDVASVKYDISSVSTENLTSIGDGKARLNFEIDAKIEGDL